MQEFAKIYALICPITNNIRYIGKTTSTLEKRLKRHKKEKNNTYKSRWIFKLKKLNLIDDLKIILIEECVKEELNIREIFYIKNYKENGFDLTNTTDGGDGSLGFKHTKKFKEHISKIFKEYYIKNPRNGINNPMYGNKHSEESKNKMSKGMKGRIPYNKGKFGTTLSDEHKEKISKSLIGNIFARGYKHSDETKKKVSEASKKYWENKKNREMSEKTKIKIHSQHDPN